jgi:hypothetical protein
MIYIYRILTGDGEIYSLYLLIRHSWTPDMAIFPVSPRSRRSVGDKLTVDPSHDSRQAIGLKAL